MERKDNIIVVEDGTETAILVYQFLEERLTEERIEATIELFAINRNSDSGLSHSSRISEFRGDPSHLAEHIGAASILLVHLAPVSRETIINASNLRLIGTARSSVSNIDACYAEETQTPIIFCPGRNAQTVAEFTFGVMLDLLRSITKAHCLVLEHAWDKNLNRSLFNGFELKGKTLGIIGFGEIGRAVSNIALGFGMNVLCFDPLIKNHPTLTIVDSQEKLLRQSDIITLHARGTNKNPILGPAEFSQMKKGAFLVNTSRGFLVDEDALIESLLQGQVAGAALDVFQQEPLPSSSPLYSFDNVLLTPHIAGMSKDMARRAALMLVDDTLRFLKGAMPLRLYRKA